MTYEEALRWTDDSLSQGKALPEQESYEYMGVVKIALEKQTAKKPYYAHYENDGEKPYIKLRCPCCKASISAVTEEEKAYQNRYCHKCGQAIDWSEEKRR